MSCTAALCGSDRDIDSLQCDQKQPRCSQCERKSETCSLQVFKIKTVRLSQPQPQPRTSSRRSRDASLLQSTKAKSLPLNINANYVTPSLVTNPTPDRDGFATGDCTLRQVNSRCSGRDEEPSPGDILEEISDQTPVTVDETIPAPTERDSLATSTRGVPVFQPSRARSVLPSDLSQSTTRRFLWDYFVNRASQIFLCWEPNDAQLDKTYNDPYADSLPALAVEDGPMRSASLALSAFHYTGGGGDYLNNSMIASLMLEASQALAASRWVTPLNPKQLLATVGTASLLYLLDPDSYADMLPLSRSAALCLTSNSECHDRREVSYQVVMQIFRWADICAQCSLLWYVPIPDESTHLRLELRADEQAARLPRSYAGWFVHPLYAFAEDLISPLRRIAWLIRVRQQGNIVAAGATTTSGDTPVQANVQDLQAQDADGNPTILQDRFGALVEEAEQLIRTASSKVRLDQFHSNSSIPEDAPDLRTNLNHLASAIHSAVVILFFTRLRDTPWTATNIRFHVRNVSEHLGNIETESRFSNGVVFPLYVAGLEAVDLENRLTIIKRMKRLRGIWSQREEHLIDSLQHVWEIRDQDPGAVWNSWVHQGKSRAGLNSLPGLWHSSN